jgi:hypothetical protein
MVYIKNPRDFLFDMEGVFFVNQIKNDVLHQGILHSFHGNAQLIFEFKEPINANSIYWNLKIRLEDFPVCELDFKNNLVNNTGENCELSEIKINYTDKLVFTGKFNPLGLGLAFNDGDLLNFESSFSVDDKWYMNKIKIDNFKNKVKEIASYIKEEVTL